MGTWHTIQIVLDNNTTLKVAGVFVEVGSEPNVDLAKKIGVRLCKEDNSIDVDEKQQTNIKWIYAAGDITNASNRLRQIITAAAEGAIAANSAYEDIKDGEHMMDKKDTSEESRRAL